MSRKDATKLILLRGLHRMRATPFRRPQLFSSVLLLMLDLTGGKPSNYFKLDGEVITETNASEDANGILGLTVSPIGVSAKLSLDLSADDYTSAMVSGPMILSNSKEREFPAGEFYDTRMARTIFGITTAGNYIMAVIDGGVTGQADGATVKEAAFVARMMGLKNVSEFSLQRALI